MAGNKPIFIIAGVLGVCLTLLFQNCGPSEYGLYGSRLPQPLGCLDKLICEENPDNLWLESYASYPAFVFHTQDIAGDCNSGGYPGNRIAVRTYKVSGTTRTPIGSVKNTICDDMGRYHVQVNLGEPASNDLFLVTMSMVGLNDQGNVVENLVYPNRSNVEVKLSFLGQ